MAYCYLEWATLGIHIPKFQGYIKFINGTSIKIHKPYNNETERLWFNKHNNMYCMNNTMVVDHHVLFIYLDIKFPSFFHDINILWKSNLFTKYCQVFVHVNKYFECLLENPNYMDERIFMMWHLGRRELVLKHNLDVMHAYKTSTCTYKVKVEWEIGGLKQKWERLMKCFDSTKEVYIHLFQAIIILTNFLHKHHLNFTYKIIND